jgi:hypothetical protein
MKTTAVFLLTIVAGLLPVRMAFADHKSWVLKNGGGDCAFVNANASEYANGVLTNNTATARTAICPVALSGRWGSSASPVFPPAVSARSMSAIVYVNKGGGGTPSCYAAMQSLNLAFFFSRTVPASGPLGPQKIVVASQNDWGGGLEPNESLWARSLDFNCLLSAAHASGNASIYAYKVKVCPADGQGTCNDGHTDHDASIDDNREGFVRLQTSGFECSPQEMSDTTRVTRSIHGIRNSGTVETRVFCPIALPADDSYEHQRQFSSARVYFKGGSSSSDCVQNRTCPVCNLQWWNRLPSGSPQGNSLVSNPFFIDDIFGGSVFGTGSNVGYDVQVGVQCALPPGVTLNGITASASVTRIQGGNL